MQKRIQLPSGRIIEVPSDITPQEELEIVTAEDAKESKPAAAPPPILSNRSAFMGGTPGAESAAQFNPLGAAAGALGGAKLGAALGPVGAGIGGVAGGLMGSFGDRNNAGDLGAVAAQAIPAVRMGSGALTAGRMAAASPRVQTGLGALKNVLSGAWRSAAGGGVAETGASLNEGTDVGTALAQGTREAGLQGGIDLAGGGLMTGAGGALRGLGRRFATKAVNPAGPDLVNWRDAYMPRPEYHTNPSTFVEGDVRRKFTDALEQEALERPGWSSFGGVREADDAILRSDIAGALKEDLVRKTVETVPANVPNMDRLYRGIEQAAARGDGDGLQRLLSQLEPTTAMKAEYTVNLDDIANAGRREAFSMGGPGAGGSPLADQEMGERTVQQFLQRRGDTRPVVSPWAALPEPKVPVPFEGSAGLDMPADVANAAAIPNLERKLRAQEAAGEDLRRVSRTDLGDAVDRPPLGDPQSGIGNVMVSHTPTSVLPTPPQFLGDAARVGAVAPQPTGGSLMMDAADARAQGLAPPTAPHNVVGFDTALQVRQNLDKDLARARQARTNAASAGQPYVPAPDERVQQAMRGELRQTLNRIAPEGRDLSGASRTLEDLLDEERKALVMAQIKAQATGDPLRAIRARGGFNPQTGSPTISVFENITAAGGGLAKPMIRGGQTALRAAPASPHLARLLAMLSNDQTSLGDTMSGINTSGFGGG